jgi:hypothetical protein
MPAAKRLVSAGMQPYAECQEDGCAWERGHGSMTRDEAKQHATQTGHKVLVITEQRDLYGVS